MAKSRTEIDKEMMYRKIMPSGSRNGRNGTGSGNSGGTGNGSSGNATNGNTTNGNAANRSETGSTGSGGNESSGNNGRNGGENTSSRPAGLKDRTSLQPDSDIHAGGPAQLFGVDPDALKLRIHPATGLQLPESHDMILVNLMEELVISRLESTLMRFNCCKCNKCKKDIAALALNRLAPKYVVINRNDEEKRKAAEAEYGSEVTGALVQAIMVVKKEPRH